MIQGVDDLHVHEVEYYDDLTGTTTVDGFATGVDLDTAPGSDDDGDVSDITFLDTTADVSALGGGETNAGSGNLYIGFNPISPSKTFSFGVGLELERRRHRGDRRVDRPQRRQPARTRCSSTAAP